MLHAFRTIEIPVEMQDRTLSIRVPFTVELLQRVEETLWDASQRHWFRLSRKEQSIIRAFEDFCRPYLPADFDFSQADPTFCAVFFSHVRDVLKRSIDDCMNSTVPTTGSDAPTGESPPTDTPPPSTRD